jgi:hypothetical protein
MSGSWMPLMNLRFVERDGKRILQQAWAEHFYTPGDHSHPGEWRQSEKHEWRDVPLESEN